VLSPLLSRTLAPPTPSGQTLHIHGAIVTPNGYIPRGTVVVAGDTIHAVHQQRTSSSAGAIELDTGGLLCPGFVDTHNHAAYAAFHRLPRPPRYFTSRFDWRGKTRCGVVVNPQPEDFYLGPIAKPFKEMTKDPAVLCDFIVYGQVRGLVGGATTMVIDADLNPNTPISLPGLPRDPSDWPGRVWGILDVGCLVDEKLLTALVAELQENKSRLLVHVGEGMDAFSRGEFVTLVTKGLLTAATSIIHALALLEEDWRKVAEKGASIIWSPVSNHRLYGRSIDIGQVIGAGIRTALAPDWSLTGSSTVLDELAFVRRSYGWIGDERLLRIVTESPADLMGMPRLGRIAPGALADLLVFPLSGVGSRPEAATRIVSSTHADIQLALVGGIAVYGVPSLVSQLNPSGSQEQIAVPLPGGGTGARLLGLAGSRTFRDTVAEITKRLNSQGLTLAPLWEP
jgi:5-methylthioadenosine/S-adenosylhomocysteine deaminase